MIRLPNHLETFDSAFKVHHGLDFTRIPMTYKADNPVSEIRRSADTKELHLQTPTSKPTTCAEEKPSASRVAQSQSSLFRGSEERKDASQARTNYYQKLKMQITTLNAKYFAEFRPSSSMLCLIAAVEVKSALVATRSPGSYAIEGANMHTVVTCKG